MSAQWADCYREYKGSQQRWEPQQSSQPLFPAKDIELVMAQANVCPCQAIKCLAVNRGDIVGAIMQLTMWAVLYSQSWNCEDGNWWPETGIDLIRAASNNTCIITDGFSPLKGSVHSSTLFVCTLDAATHWYLHRAQSYSKPACLSVAIHTQLQHCGTYQTYSSGLVIKPYMQVWSCSRCLQHLCYVWQALMVSSTIWLLISSGFWLSFAYSFQGCMYWLYNQDHLCQLFYSQLMLKVCSAQWWPWGQQAETWVCCCCSLAAAIVHAQPTHVASLYSMMQCPACSLALSFHRATILCTTH